MQEKFHFNFLSVKIIAIMFFNVLNIKDRCHDYDYNNAKKQAFKISKLLHEQL
jgi:hypothetical protein